MAQILPSSPNETQIVITIDDTSPTIAYAPFADTHGSPNLTAGWNPSYSETGFTPDPANGEGVGTSLHVTSADGATLSLRWNGTAVSLCGFFPTSTSGFPSTVSYSIALDGTATTNYAFSFSPDSDPAKSVLASFTDLTNGEHVVELTMHNPDDLDDILQFDRAVITSGLPAQPTNQSSNVTLVTQTLADDSVSFRGQWSFNSNLLPGQNASFHSSSNIGDQASVRFNGTSVTLAGLTTPLSGSYNISLDNGAPETFSARSSFNLSSPTLLFFRTGLNAGVVHQLDIVNAGASAGAQGSLLIIGSVNVTTVEDGNGTQPAMSTSRRLGAGTIAAIAVGAALAVVVIVALSVCYARRRLVRQRKQGFIVNPRVSNRRLSFLPRLRHHADPEKNDRGRVSVDAEILDISHSKAGDGDEDEDEDEEARGRGDPEDPRDARHASQNSDGSYAINLPELPGQSYVRVRTEGDSPSPTRRFASTAPLAQTPPPRTTPSPVIFHAASPTSSIPRSPKPRGPREMRSSLSISREGPQGILLKRVQTLPTDASMTLRADNQNTTLTTLSPSNNSPLRVNFEEAPEDSESRPQRKSTRSVASAISLPQSLRNAFHWGHRASEVSSDIPTSEGEVRSYPRYSFLDMDSSASQSSGSRSARQSASTRSSRSRQASTGPESSSGQCSSDSQAPRDNRMSLALSMTLAGGPTSSHPSLSPAISLQAVPLPPLSVPELRIGADDADVPQSVHPTDLTELQLLPSPTDSIPLTVSDIHFRYSTQSSASTSGAESRGAQQQQQQRHPPMPPAPAPSLASTGQSPPDTRPYIVQKLTGSPNAGPDPSTPYGTPRLSAPTPSSSAVWRRPRAIASGPSFSSLMPSRPSTRES
ncbi:uncharacterized protein PHACADRAFT_210467 [Phanerochaete carnosa HHB-10118-sp]|uniref:Uncharacterized protein n=1 Tax=Phanerochaete carnosa (strain HHB-10118-sp) TaxID=650164 RepID=K5UX62_PHACS|nr:uncharacterized protein PHACADRAFT_210467 [Phanerochaete carnosa HHB-10118-sp]EKM54681.1 hypothetical protein PHACADRAFT_210467 [Phanerochaete carnosa HHB-10118-sp]